MKVFFFYKPRQRLDNFEGTRLTSSTLNAFKSQQIDYVLSAVQEHDFVHIISPDDEVKAHDGKEEGSKILVSALYCEGDRTCRFFEYKSDTMKINARSLRLLERADAVLVPTELSKKILQDHGVRSQINVVPLGVDTNRFVLNEVPEQDIFFHYFQLPKDRKIILTIGEFSDFTALRRINEAAKKNPNAIFFFLAPNRKKWLLSLKSQIALKKAPKNVFHSGLVEDDVYRSAMANADALFVCNSSKIGVASIMDAMAASLQIIAHENAITPDLLIDKENAYISKDTNALIHDLTNYLNGVLASTKETAFTFANKNSIENYGQKLKEVYTSLLQERN